MTANFLTIFTALATAGVLIFWRRLARSPVWLATVTPLASIMGSGFLVCAPLLAATVGIYAAPAMAVLLLLAYAIGAVIRFNIRHAEPLLASGSGKGPDEPPPGLSPPSKPSSASSPPDVAGKAPDVTRRAARKSGYLLLAAICLAVAVLGISAG